MSTTTHTTTDPLPAARGLLWAVGATALGVFAADRPLFGAGVYAVAAAAAVGLGAATGEHPGYDDPVSPAERTLATVGMASAVVFPALVAADGLGYFSWGPLSAGVAVGVVGLFALYGAFALVDSPGGER